MATITKRQGKKGLSYLIRVYAGYTPSGRQIEKTKTWRPPVGMSEKKANKESEKVAALFEQQVINGLNPGGDRITLSDFIEIYMDKHAYKHNSPCTSDSDLRMIPVIDEKIGHIILAKLQPIDLMGFYDSLAGIGENRGAQKAISITNIRTICRKHNLTMTKICQVARISDTTLRAACNGKTISINSANKIANALGYQLQELFRFVGTKKCLSDSSILRYHTFLSSVLQTAVQWQFIPANPAKRIKPPRVEHKEAHYLTDDECLRLQEALLSAPIKWRTACLLLLYTGMRRGELCGLEWHDIDFEQHTIHICRNAQYIPSMGIITKEPKSKTSQRTMKLPSEIFSMLKDYKAWQSTKRLKLGDVWPDTLDIKGPDGKIVRQKNDRVFTTEEGGLIFPTSITSWISKFRKDNNLPFFTPHTLRHTNISLLLAAGVPLRTVSGRAGHAQSSTTLNIYSHVIPSTDAIAASALSVILNPNAKNKIG